MSTEYRLTGKQKPPGWAANVDKKRRYGIIEWKERCYIKRLATSLRREVMLMGNGRGVKALRFLVCFIIVLFLMIATAPKAY